MAISEKAILVRMKRTQYSPYRFDKGATQQLENALGVQGVGRYNKKLFKDCKLLKATQDAYNDAYNYLIGNTLPWMDEGVRILPNGSVIDFTTELKRLCGIAEQKVDDLYQAWDGLVGIDVMRLGALGNFGDYPNAEEMRDKWSINVVYMPIPTEHDFRVQMMQEDVDNMKAEMEKAEEECTKHLIKEILKPVRAMADRLSNPIGAPGATFRDTLVGNVRDILSRAGKLNINNSQDITDVCKEIEDALKGVTAQELRDVQTVRSDVQRKMDAISSKMASWMA